MSIHFYFCSHISVLIQAQLCFSHIFFFNVFNFVYFFFQLIVPACKGVYIKVLSRLELLYKDSRTIPVVNNVLGRTLMNIRGCLRQGCPGSMGWFSVAIDPLLVYLERRLMGIPI